MLHLKRGHNSTIKQSKVINYFIFFYNFIIKKWIGEFNFQKHFLQLHFLCISIVQILFSFLYLFFLTPSLIYMSLDLYLSAPIFLLSFFLFSLNFFLYKSLSHNLSFLLPTFSQLHTHTFFSLPLSQQKLPIFPLFRRCRLKMNWDSHLAPS